MRPSSYPDTAELITRRMLVEATVHASFKKFIAHRRTEMGEPAFERLSSIAEKDLHAVPSELREVLVHISSGRADFESAPYWKMIDSICFVSDSMKGRWLYMDVAGRDRSLINALECANEVGQMLAGTHRPKAIPVEYSEADEVADAVFALIPRG